MIEFSRGDVILVGFVFSDETGEKRRPAVVISSNAYQLGRQEAIIAAITSKVERRLLGDHLIVDWQEAGLLFPSVVTGIIRTIKQSMIFKRLGTMSHSDMLELERNLREVLGLKTRGQP